jgi:hypothetical protein
MAQEEGMRGAETARDDEFGDMETPEGTGEGQAMWRIGRIGLFAAEPRLL